MLARSSEPHQPRYIRVIYCSYRSGKNRSMSLALRLSDAWADKSPRDPKTAEIRSPKPSKSLSLNRKPEWLRILGFRGPADTDVQRVLAQEGHDSRLAEIRSIPSSDLMVVMVGLLRVTAECCQLVYQHPQLAPDVEVTVEEEDENMWMQRPCTTSTTATTLATPIDLCDSLQESSMDGTTTGEENAGVIRRRRRVPYHEWEQRRRRDPQAREDGEPRAGEPTAELTAQSDLERLLEDEEEERASNVLTQHAGVGMKRVVEMQVQTDADSFRAHK